MRLNICDCDMLLLLRPLPCQFLAPSQFHARPAINSHICSHIPTPLSGRAKRCPVGLLLSKHCPLPPLPSPHGEASQRGTPHGTPLVGTPPVPAAAHDYTMRVTAHNRVTLSGHTLAVVPPEPLQVIHTYIHTYIHTLCTMAAVKGQQW